MRWLTALAFIAVLAACGSDDSTEMICTPIAGGQMICEAP